MFKIRDFSISKKLTWMNMLVSGVALLLACAAFFAYDLYTFRTGIVRNLSVQAQIIGSNTVSALVFDDPHAAENTLSALKASPNIVYAAVYTLEGERSSVIAIAEQRNRLGRLPPLPAGRSEVHWFAARTDRFGSVHHLSGQADGLCLYPLRPAAPSTTD